MIKIKEKEEREELLLKDKYPITKKRDLRYKDNKNFENLNHTMKREYTYKDFQIRLRKRKGFLRIMKILSMYKDRLVMMMLNYYLDKIFMNM